MHAARRELHAKKIGDDLRGALYGQQLPLRQINQRALDHRAILHRRRDMLRKDAAMVLTTPAHQFIAKVFGHLHYRLHQIEHLTPILDQRIGLGYQGAPRNDHSAWAAGGAPSHQGLPHA